eukprot:13095287-Alexandrium_andersonii.AAC.1
MSKWGCASTPAHNARLGFQDNPNATLPLQMKKMPMESRFATLNSHLWPCTLLIILRLGPTKWRKGSP